MNTFKLSAIASVLILSSCKTGLNPAPVATQSPSAGPTSVPSAMPTVGSSAVPIDGQSTPPVFSTSQSSLCPGDALTIALVRSNLNRGSVPIVFQYHPRFIPGSVEPTPEPDLPKDPVQLGQMQVAPTGEGEFRFTLQTSYVSRNGAKVEIKAGDFLSLYAETSPGNYARINDISLCPPIPSPDPNSPPTPQPSAPGPESELIDATQSDVSNQAIFSVSDHISFYTQLWLQGQNALVTWVSEGSNDLDTAGRIIENLQPAGYLPQAAVPGHERIFPVFNAQGNGFLIWKPQDSGSTPQTYTVSIRPLQGFQAQNPIQQLNGIITSGFMQASGKGSLFEMRGLEADGSIGPEVELWRYPIINAGLQTDPVKLARVPSRSWQVNVDADGNGFILWNRDRVLDVNPPYSSGIIYLQAYQPTGETFTFPEEPYRSTAAQVNVHNGNGTIVIPELDFRRQRYQIYPVRNYRLLENERRLLTMPAPLGRAIPLYSSCLRMARACWSCSTAIENCRQPGSRTLLWPVRATVWREPLALKPVTRC